MNSRADRRAGACARVPLALREGRERLLATLHGNLAPVHKLLLPVLRTLDPLSTKHRTSAVQAKRDKRPPRTALFSIPKGIGLHWLVNWNRGGIGGDSLAF